MNLKKFTLTAQSTSAAVTSPINEKDLSASDIRIRVAGTELIK
jgi:hypothetical protein